jgi:broad-specificity NMP kinase
MTDMENLFFWETVAALAFFSALVLGVIFSMRLIIDAIKNMASKGRKHKSILHTSGVLTDTGTGLRQEVIARFTEAHEHSELAVRSGYQPVLVDYLLERLRGTFTIKSLSQICNLNSTYCNMINHLTDSEGNVFLLGLSWNDRQLFDSKGRLNYIGEQTPSDFSFTGDEGEDRIILSNMAELAFPASLSETHPSLIEILNALKEGEMKSVQHEDKKPNQVKVFKLIYHRVTGYALAESKSTISTLSNRMLDLSYSDVEYDFMGKTHTMSMSKAIPVLIESLKLGENGLVFGPPGVGKSTLLEQLQSRMANNEDIRVIIMTPAQIRELQNSEAKTAFEAALSSTTVKNIIFIDEGETLLEKSANGLHTDDNSIILQMMSGGLQKALNCQLVIAFNANPEDLNKALFRKGRAGMIMNLKPLPAEKSNALLQEVKKLYPERTFDKEQYRKLLNEVNTSVDKSTYARAGFITLADLYSAFPHKSKHAAIVRALSNATGAPVEVIVEKIEKPASIVEHRPGRPERKLGVMPGAAPQKEQPAMRASSGGKLKNWNKRR